MQVPPRSRLHVAAMVYAVAREDLREYLKVYGFVPVHGRCSCEAAGLIEGQQWRDYLLR